MLVTHEHSDHVAGLRVFAKRFGVPVYGSQGTLEALRQSLAGITCGLWSRAWSWGDAGVVLPPEPRQRPAHRVPAAHRGRQGLRPGHGHGDLLQETLEGLWGADLAVVESNHDKEMLRLGGYPLPLKRRILSERGHLSNEDCAGLLPRLLGRAPGGFCWPT